MSKHIKAFQKKHNLVSDGIIGKNTLAAMRCEWGSLTDSQLAHFLANTHHETGGFERDTENLNYSAHRLGVVFPRYFPNDTLIRQYAGNPMKIANRVYGNRMGNGNEASGDGWKYIGRGAIQLTGKNNYSAFAKWIKDSSILEHPEKVATDYFWETGLFYFTVNDLWKLAKYEDSNAVKAIRRAINGGYNGLEDTQNKFKYYLNLIRK